MSGSRVLLAVVTLATLGVAACAPRLASLPSTPTPASLVHWDPQLYAAVSYDPHWWRQLEDPVLDALEAAAREANHDLQMAVARLDQARAVFDESDRLRYPRVTADAAVDVREQAQPGFLDTPVRTTTYRAGLSASWEIDLFGRVRSAVRAASATADAFEADLASVHVSVAADVAQSYFALRGLQQRLAVLERSLVNQRESLRLTEVRRDAGIGEEQDVASAMARVAAIEAAAPPLRIALAAREHRLAVLTGVRPGALPVDLAPRTYPPIARALAIGDPARLLDRRPDVRAAGARLNAAAAREGIAAADLYPRISITGLLGLLAGRGNLFGSADSRAWAVTPALDWSAFDIGSVRARLRGVQAGTREAAARYEQTLLLALEETETALVTYAEDQRRLVSLADQMRESTRAAGIARTRYREGLADFLSLLDAERTQLQAEDAVADAEAGVLAALVGIYRAVGGLETGG